MLLENYYTKNQNTFSVTPQQASDFAKFVAGDFNPIHDADAKRYCAPGDLLFAIVVSNFGLFEKMSIEFSGMVSDTTSLIFTDLDKSAILSDENEKQYLSINKQGLKISNQKAINSLIEKYVEFSGQAFPHVLVPQMSEKNVMINPDRPLVIYKQMEIEIEPIEFSEPELQLTNTIFDVNGKRGEICLEFDIREKNNKIGNGKKIMTLSGLRPFDQEQIDTLVENYNTRKNNFLNSQ